MERGNKGIMRTSLSKEDLVDKVKGLIYGAAIGDGLGLATEFMSKQQATLLYGNGPIKFGHAEGHEYWRDAHRNRWFENDFTDDTDQFLLILQSLLADGGTLNPLHFAYRIHEWSRVGFPELQNKLPNGIGFTVGSTFSHENFLSDPLRASYDIWNKNERNLAANGAVMRTAVIGVPSFWDEKKVVQNSMMAAKVTHADPRSVTSAVIVSVIISRLLRGSLPVVSEDQEKDREQALQIIHFGSTDDRSYLEEFENESKPIPKQIYSPIHRRIVRGIRRFEAYILGHRWDPLFDVDFYLPQYPNTDINRYSNPAPLRPNVKKMDEFGDDEDMIKMCRDVVDKYKFLVESHSLCPSKEDFEKNEAAKENETATKSTSVTTWVDELYSHCFPDSISSLKLDENRKIGYTYKCLGASVYTATRKIPEEMLPQEFFTHLITELALETGDADTNCAAAGAILGCRLGKSGLPKSWVDGLRHKDFLENIADNLCKLLLKSMEEST